MNRIVLLVFALAAATLISCKSSMIIGADADATTPTLRCWSGGYTVVFEPDVKDVEFFEGFVRYTTPRGYQGVTSADCRLIDPER